MVNVTIFQDHKGRYTRFQCLGHAGYADAGEDVVCAGVSVLVINTINALEAFTNEAFDVQTDEKSGRIDVQFSHPTAHDGSLLLQTMVLGLQAIQHNYGTKYIVLDFKEV